MAKILIVDDNEQIRELAKDVIESWGHTIFLAEEGRSCVEMALQILPDIILLDVMLPGLSGYEVCRLLKTKQQTQNIPVIMISALTDVENRIHSYKVGADMSLVKPMNYEELRSIINKLLWNKANLATMEPLHSINSTLKKIYCLTHKDAQAIETEENYYLRFVEILGLNERSEERLLAIATFKAFYQDEKNLLTDLKLWDWLEPLLLYVEHYKAGIPQELTDKLVFYKIEQAADIVLLVSRFLAILKEQNGSSTIALNMLKNESAELHYNDELLKKLELIINDENLFAMMSK